MSRFETSSRVVISNFFWNLMERWGAQGVTFIVSIILARILEPESYGIVAMASVLTSILSVFIDSGLGSALVQKKDADEYDFSTVFYFNIVMCVLLYFAVFFSAPFLSNYYNIPTLTPIIRVSSLSLIIAGFKNILISKIQRDLKYKQFFFATLGGTIGAAFVGIIMAVKGFGVWALVVQTLFNSTVDTIVLWITVKWRPKVYFSLKKLKHLLGFGFRMLGSSLVDTIYNRLRDLIIGKKYSAVDLAYYNKASGWPNLLFVNFGGAVDSVMFPVMSRAQDNKDQVKAIMSKTIRLNTYIVFPMLTGLAICAKPMIEIVLTEKWLPILEYMRIFCFTFACDAVHNTQVNMIRSIGRIDIFLKINVVKKCIGIMAILITMGISVKALAYSLIAIRILELIINLFVVKRLLNYSVMAQISDFIPNLVLCVLMSIPVLLLSRLPLAKILSLVISIPMGIIAYAFFSMLFGNESYVYVKNMAKSIICK